MTAPIVGKRADELAIGDRILPEHLPAPIFREPGEVVYVKVHAYRGGRFVFVAFTQDNGFYDSTSFEVDEHVEVFPADTGLGYSRADDGETTQNLAGRVPTHFGAVVNEVGGPQELLAIAPGADGGVAFALAPSGAVTDPVARAKAVELTEAVAANPPEGFVPAKGFRPDLEDACWHGSDCSGGGPDCWRA